MIGFLCSFSAEVVIWGSLWWPCWRSEERQSAGLTSTEQCCHNALPGLCILTSQRLLDWGTEPVHFPPPSEYDTTQCVQYTALCSKASFLYASSSAQQRLIETLRSQCRQGSDTQAMFATLQSTIPHTSLANCRGTPGIVLHFNGSGVFDLPMFIFFDVNWHSGEELTLNVVQHEGRLIHYPLKGEACGWGVHLWGLIIFSSTV